MKDKGLDQKTKGVWIKVLFALVVAIVCFLFVFFLGFDSFDQLPRKIIGFISYFIILALLLYEFMIFFPLPTWAKFYVPLLSFLSFFSSWDITLNWFSSSNISFNKLISNQYEFVICGIPGLGYVMTLVLCFIPYLFCHKNFKQIIGYFAINYLIVLILLVTARAFMFMNIDNWLFLLITIIGSILCDSFAYFFGISIGNKIFKKKLAPKISPNKTIEGAIGGFLISWLFLFLVFWFINFKYLNLNNLVTLIILPIIIPLFSIIGDLVFSLVKRKLKIKDYSSLIPNHGGLLDRLDSISITCFVTFSLFIII